MTAPRKTLSISTLTIAPANPADPTSVARAVEAALRARLAGSESGAAAAADHRLGQAAGELGGRIAARARTGGIDS
jgi:hypothetical protein